MSVTLLTRLCPLLCAVYGRENRLKVARDEAQHAAEEAEALEKHLKAEAEHRHRLLLQRARQRRNTDHQQQPALEAADNQDHEQEDSLEHAPLLTVEERPSTNSPPAATAVASTTEKAEDTPGHINFWADLEAKAAHPDKEKERKEQLRKRGNPDTHTSDARFDEQFQLGYGLAGQKPWYARTPSTVDAAEPSTSGRQLLVGTTTAAAADVLQHQQQSAAAAALAQPVSQQLLTSSKRRKRHKHHGSSTDNSSSSTSSSDSSDTDNSRQRARSSRSSSKHRNEKSKHSKARQKHSKIKHDAKQSRAKLSSGGVPSKTLAELRQERIQREQQERVRTQQLLDNKLGR
eukprot:jgi/Chrzof1/14422/Cz09g02100.t1